MRGRGYTEFLACRDEIVKLLEAGHTISQVWNILSSQGKVTTKYRNFFNVLKKFNVRPIQLEHLKTGAELATETLKKLFPPTHPAKPRILVSEDIGTMVRKPPEKLWEQSKEPKREASDSGFFDLERKDENDVF